jgi:hypothetical protein
LPNGNTLIDEGMNGRFFQVTASGENVWEYVSPYLGKAPGSDAISNWVYRALPVSYDWVPAGTPRSGDGSSGAGHWCATNPSQPLVIKVLRNRNKL